MRAFVVWLAWLPAAAAFVNPRIPTSSYAPCRGLQASATPQRPSRRSNVSPSMLAIGHITKDVVVIGGGLAGLSTALELARRGRQVTVLRRDRTEAASYAAGGMLAPQAERLESGAYLDLCLSSRAMYSDWIESIEALAGIGLPAGSKPPDTGFWSAGGFLAPAFKDDAVHKWTPPAEGGHSQWLNTAQLLDMEPLISDQCVGGWWFPQDMNVDARALYSVLETAAIAAGAELLDGVSARGLVFNASGSRAEAVVLSDGRQAHAATIVGAAGAWMRQLLPVPMTAHKGQMMSLRPAPRRGSGSGSSSSSSSSTSGSNPDYAVGAGGGALGRVLFAEAHSNNSIFQTSLHHVAAIIDAYTSNTTALRSHVSLHLTLLLYEATLAPVISVTSNTLYNAAANTGAYIIPKRDGRIVLGATVEKGVWERHNTPAGIAQLIAAATKVCPELSTMAIEETWAGLRPVTPDTLPVLGASHRLHRPSTCALTCILPAIMYANNSLCTRWDNVFIAGGYWRNGVLLAPRTAQLLADAVMGTLSSADAAVVSTFSVDRFTTSSTSSSSSTSTAGSTIGDTPAARSSFTTASTTAAAAAVKCYCQDAHSKPKTLQGTARSMDLACYCSTALIRHVRYLIRVHNYVQQQPVQAAAPVVAVQPQQQQSQPAAAVAAAAVAVPTDRGVINEQRLFERAVAEATAEGSVFDGLYGMFEPGGRGMIPPDSDFVIPAAAAAAPQLQQQQLQQQQQQQQQAVATVAAVAAVAEDDYEPVNDYDAAPDFSEECKWNYVRRVQRQIASSHEAVQMQQMPQFCCAYLMLLGSNNSLKAARQSNRNLDKIFNEEMFDEVEVSAEDYVESPYAWEPEAVAAAAAAGAQIIEIDVPDGDIAWLEKVMSGQPEAHSDQHVEHAKVVWAREAADGGPVAVPFGTNIYKMAQQGLLKLRGQAELLPQPGASSSSDSYSGGDRNEFVKGAEERSDEVTALYAAIMENKKAAKAAAAAAAASGSSSSSNDGSSSEPRVNGHANGHTLQQNGAASGIAHSKPGWFARVFKGEKSSDGQQQHSSSDSSSSSSNSSSAATTPVSVDSNRSWATAAADTTEQQQQQQQQLTVTQLEAQSLDRELTDYEEASFDAYDFIMVHRDNAGSVADAARASNRLDSADEQAAFEAAFASIGISDSSPK
eukprot:4523-Heterococcus_DN1.PRE.1